MSDVFSAILYGIVMQKINYYYYYYLNTGCFCFNVLDLWLFISSITHGLCHSRAPRIPGNENGCSRIPGNEKTRPGMHSLSMTEDSDVEEPAWKKMQLADVNIIFDRIQVVPSVAITGDKLPLEFFTHFIDETDQSHPILRYLCIETVHLFYTIFEI